MNKYNNFYLRPTSVARNRSIPSLTDRPTSSQGLTYKPSREYLLQTPLPSSDLKHIDQNISLETPNHRQLDISIGQPNHHYSSHLSLLTLKANEQLKIKERHAYAQPKVLNRSSTQVSVKKVPGSQEIDKILDRLEKVANNQAGGMRKPVLKEAKPMHVIMEQGETQYFKIGVKGKNCPMRVSIKRNKGNYKIYASKTVSEPNEMLHDYAFRTDYFIISDIGLSFKFDSIYLGIVALENSSLEITVFFGKRGQEVDQNDNLFRSPGSVSFRAYRSKSSRKLEELMRNDTLRENLRRKAEEILNQRKAQAILLSGNKDFLKMNMAPLSPARLRASSATREMREQRRNEVKVRKENIVTERNIRLKTLMQRHDARKIEIEEEKKSRRLKETVDNCYKKWFSIIYFSKGIISILDHVRENRQSIIKRLVCNASARKIQRACRIIWASISVSKLKVLRARNNLLLYYSQCKPIIQITDSARIVKFIHEAATNFLIHRHFRSTYNKSIL